MSRCGDSNSGTIARLDPDALNVWTGRSRVTAGAHLSVCVPMGTMCNDRPCEDAPAIGDTQRPSDGSLDALVDALAKLVADLAFDGRLNDLENHEDGDLQ